jgi:hypothetical protein
MHLETAVALGAMLATVKAAVPIGVAKALVLLSRLTWPVAQLLVGLVVVALKAA